MLGAVSAAHYDASSRSNFAMYTPVCRHPDMFIPVITHHECTLPQFSISHRVWNLWSTAVSHKLCIPRVSLAAQPIAWIGFCFKKKCASRNTAQNIPELPSSSPGWKVGACSRGRICGRHNHHRTLSLLIFFSFL